MAAHSMSGRGILFVTSQISQPDVLDRDTYFKWYDEDHIAEIIQTSGVKSARRFIDVDPAAEKPYLAMYPMDDIGFTQGDEFRRIRVESDMLPPPGTIYDLVDFDVRYGKLVHVYDPTTRGRGVARTLLTAAIELREGTSVDEFDRWYREEHCPRVAKARGYLRTTRFQLAYARTNAQSRVLKGLAPPTDEEAPPSSPPATWLGLHEFECEPRDVSMAELGGLTASPWNDKMLASFTRFECHFYGLAREFGDRDWFHGVDV